MVPIAQRILVPTDFSEGADDALAYALTLANQVGATVHLVHVFEDPDAVALYSHAYVPMPADMRSDILTNIHRELSVRAATGPREVTSEVLIGSPAKTIVDTASHNHFDLIVMGTHGRHGVARLLLGSVADRVIRTATCPVLVVPHRRVN